MIKVVHLITGLSVGGAETMLFRLLSNTNRSEFQPIVISMLSGGNYQKGIEQLGIPVNSLNMSRGIPSAKGIWRLKVFLKEIKPNIIQGRMYHGNLAASVGKYLNSFNAKTLWNVRHSLDDMEKEKGLTSKVIKAGAFLSGIPEHIIYNSYRSAQQHEIIGYQSKKSVIIPNGFDCAIFQPDEIRRILIRREIGVAHDTFVVGIVARYHPIKGYKYFLQAASLVIKSGYNMHFILIGKDITYLNKELSNLINQLKLEDNVHLLGERQDLPSIYPAMDVFASTSTSEAFSNAIGEAMASGVPAVVTDVGDSARIVGNNDFIVPPKNSEAIAQVFIRIYQMNHEARRKLGEDCRQRIIDLYSIPQVIALYENIYRKVAS